MTFGVTPKVERMSALRTGRFLSAHRNQSRTAHPKPPPAARARSPTPHRCIQQLRGLATGISRRRNSRSTRTNPAPASNRQINCVDLRVPDPDRDLDGRLQTGHKSCRDQEIRRHTRMVPWGRHWSSATYHQVSSLDAGTSTPRSSSRFRSGQRRSASLSQWWHRSSRSGNTPGRTSCGGRSPRAR